MSAQIDPKVLTALFQLTKAMHRDVYPPIDPKKLAPFASNKVILITGSGGGLGYAVAKTWTEVNAKGVVLVGRNEQKLESVAKELKGNTLVAAGDITNEENVKAIFEKAIARFGTVDVVLNAAGIFNYGTIGDMGPSQWWAEHEINVKATYILAHYLHSLQQRSHHYIHQPCLPRRLHDQPRPILPQHLSACRYQTRKTSRSRTLQRPCVLRPSWYRGGEIRSWCRR
ncbi:hypothetical protein PMIN06_005782 [Paraphaeosphaeria minitans]